ncbi:hypothetical protein PUR32_35190 [Streptomyces sp. BE133]|nr:hypothetical protein [Streptomyces sp. BE133]
MSRAEATSRPRTRSSAEVGTRSCADSGPQYWYRGAGRCPLRPAGRVRSAETPAGTALMGVRLYSPSTRHFPSLDPVHDGKLNAYEYAHGGPVNRLDLDRRWSRSRSKSKSKTRYYSWGYVYARAWTTKTSLRTTAYHFQVDLNSNRSCTAKIGRSGRWHYGPL